MNTNSDNPKVGRDFEEKVQKYLNSDEGKKFLGCDKKFDIESFKKDLIL